jgi:glycosyltransferase involved in cell wall biosynthesis
VGDWRDSQCQALCTGITEREGLPITFHGPKYDDEKLAFYSASDVLVFIPREPEGHPWVVVEALAAGLPVIATNRGAISESVRHEENGFLLKDGDPERVADAMHQLILDPTLILKMGDASRRYYEAGFTEARMVERFRNAFDQVIASA